jgi:DNA replication protein DnaC
MSSTNDITEIAERIADLLGTFKLPTLSEELVPRFTQAGRADVLPLVLDVLELEESDRRERRTDRLRRASRLPPAKTLATLDDTHLPRQLMQQIKELSRGAFLDKAINVLAFGRPGVGKSHASCAIGHELITAGHSVLFAPAYQLVQELLAAKRALDLPRALRKLDAFELLIIDSCGVPGYVESDLPSAEKLVGSLHISPAGQRASSH